MLGLCWIHRSLHHCGCNINNLRTLHHCYTCILNRSERWKTLFRYNLLSLSKSAQTFVQKIHEMWWKWLCDNPILDKPRDLALVPRTSHRKNPSGHNCGFAWYPHAQEEIPLGELRKLMESTRQKLISWISSLQKKPSVEIKLMRSDNYRKAQLLNLLQTVKNWFFF